MFEEFSSQIFTPSGAAVTVSNNTDYTVDGVSSKRIVWANGKNETCTMSFNAVTLSNYEEISLHIAMVDLFATGNVFKMTIDGNEYVFDKFLRRGWQHIIIDCSSMGSVSSIVFESLVDDLSLFIDYIGYRKVGHDREVDLLEAFQNKINLSTSITTTLGANVVAGATSITLASNSYIGDNSILRLDNGGGITEDVQLISKSGKLTEAITNPFTTGDVVTLMCPVLLSSDTVESDPVCGIVIVDKEADKRIRSIQAKDKMLYKQYTGMDTIQIYIDCSSEKILHQLTSLYNYNYGERFQILLDGEPIDVILERDSYLGDLIGNNPRMNYFYMLEAQPIKIKEGEGITALTLTQASMDPELLYDTEVNG